MMQRISIELIYRDFENYSSLLEMLLQLEINKQTDQTRAGSGSSSIYVREITLYGVCQGKGGYWLKCFFFGVIKTKDRFFTRRQGHLLHNILTSV